MAGLDYTCSMPTNRHRTHYAIDRSFYDAINYTNLTDKVPHPELSTDVVESGLGVTRSGPVKIYHLGLLLNGERSGWPGPAKADEFSWRGCN